MRVRAAVTAFMAYLGTSALKKTPGWRYAWTLVVLADTDVADMQLADRASALAAITQLHAGLACDHFILSESTFHYWIAVLRGVLPPRRPAVQVVVFEGMDLANRPLALKGWTRLPC